MTCYRHKVRIFLPVYRLGGVRIGFMETGSLVFSRIYV